MLVHEFLTLSASQVPQKIALVCGGRRFTYADLDQMSNRLGNALALGGVRRGDRASIKIALVRQLFRM